MRALLALFLRSLKEDVRGKSTYVLRATLVALVLFFLWITHTATEWTGAVGRNFFAKVVWIDLFVLSVVGLTYFASAITEEKENETLGLLRMTDLNALSILLGKSTSRMLGALFILTAQLPFMLVAVTMGGLAVKQVFAGFICLLGYGFLLANLGLMCSVVARRSSGATMLSGVLIFLLQVTPWWVYGTGVLFGTSSDEFLTELARATPFVRMTDILRTDFAGNIVGMQFLFSIVAGIACFGLSWLLFDRLADPHESQPGLGMAPSAGDEITPAQALAGRAKTPALRWKDYSFVAGGDTAVAIKAVLALLILVSCIPSWRWDTTGRMMVYGGFTSVWTGLFLVLCVALDASRIFKKEREQNTLSGLLTLPMSAQQIVREKALGCLRASWPAMGAFGITIVIFALGWMEMLLKEVSRPNSRFWDDVLLYVVSGVITAILYLLLLPVLIAWLSLRMRWGALPVGFTIWIIAIQIVLTVMILIFQQGALVLLPAMFLAAIIGMVKDMPAKLEKLAAEE